jgi:hypothetical protein
MSWHALHARTILLTLLLATCVVSGSIVAMPARTARAQQAGAQPWVSLDQWIQHRCDAMTWGGEAFLLPEAARLVHGALDQMATSSETPVGAAYNRWREAAQSGSKEGQATAMADLLSATDPAGGQNVPQFRIVHTAPSGIPEIDAVFTRARSAAIWGSPEEQVAARIALEQMRARYGDVARVEFINSREVARMLNAAARSPETLSGVARMGEELGQGLGRVAARVGEAIERVPGRWKAVAAVVALIVVWPSLVAHTPEIGDTCGHPTAN